MLELRMGIADMWQSYYMLHIVEKSLILHILYIHRPYLLGKTKTMNEEKKTPLWLDLRKEYIDDNFAKLQEYLI